MSDLSQNQIDELLDALRTAPTEADAGITAPELAGLLGVNKETVRDRLRRLIAEGKAKPVRVKRERLDGIVHTVSGYRIAS